MAHLTLVLALLLTSFCSASAKGYYQLSARARLAYEQITALRMTEATATLSLMKRQEPDNLMVHHLENYYDFFDLYIREDESRYRARLPPRDKRLAAIADGEARSPYHLYVQAEIRLHWALLRLRFEDYWAAFNDINQAHRLLLRNQERFPEDFMFQLSAAEKAEVVTNCDHLANLKFAKTSPYAFTEHGAIQAANVLSSPRAVGMGVYVVRAFVRLREVLASSKELTAKLNELEHKVDSHDQAIAGLINAMRELMRPPEPQKKRSIGFVNHEEKPKKDG